MMSVPIAIWASWQPHDPYGRTICRFGIELGNWRLIGIHSSVFWVRCQVVRLPMGARSEMGPDEQGLPLILTSVRKASTSGPELLPSPENTQWDGPLLDSRW